MYFLGEREYIIIGVVAGVFILGISLLFIFAENGNEKVNLENDSLEEIEIKKEVLVEDATKEIETKNNSIKENTSIENVSTESVFKNISEVENTSVEEKVIIIRTFNLSIDVQEEDIVLEKEGRELNINEKIVDVFGGSAKEEHLPIFLNSESNAFGNYNQEIFIGENLTLTNFSDNDYLEGEVSKGFQIFREDVILEYEIDFESRISWEDLIKEYIFIFGKKYMVVESDYDSQEIKLFETPIKLILKENEIVEIETPFGKTNISIYFITTDAVSLKINEERVKTLDFGGGYNGDNFWLFVSDILYSEKREGGVELVISPNRIVLKQENLQHKRKNIEGLYTSFISSSREDLEKIKISWIAEDEIFLTSNSPLVIPFFETVNLSMSDKFSGDDEDYWKIYLNAMTKIPEWN